MAQAEANRAQLALVLETAYGVTPTTPSTQAIEYVTFNGNLAANALSDPSIRSDRQTAYSRRGNSSTTGTLEVVLAPEQHDMLIEAALMGTWTGDELMVGTTKRSFAVEQGFLDLALYRVFNGVMVNTWSFNVTPEELVTSSFGLIGSSTTAFSGTSIDGTPTAPPVVDKYFHEGGSFNEGGAAIAYLSSITGEVNNNITGAYALGALGYRNLTAGKVAVTGTVTGLFESAALYNKFRNDTDTSLSFTLVASGSHSFQVNLPRVKYTSGTITSTGNAGVTVSMNYEALYDGTLGNTMRIVRA